MSLVSRHLEANGIPTVIIGAARDIVEHCGVTRLLFVDFPLGNPCGQPDKTDMQRAIFAQALDLLETAEGPNTTVRAPYDWSAGERWKDLIFTQEQPFQDPDEEREWKEKKELYRKLKAEGKT